jgi:cytidylate kinase
MRDNETIEKALVDTIERELSEKKRYMMYYGIDLNDTSVYDLMVNTDAIDADQVVRVILDALEALP